MSIIISRKKIISIYIAAAIILSQLHIPAFTQSVFADERISYINDEGEEEFVPSDKKVILTTESNWKDGRWYVAEGQVSINKRVTVKGDVSLILKDGAELNIPKGITIEDDKSLAIYGQEKSSGKLVISSDEIDVEEGFAAIGGSNKNTDAGSIEINGGEIIVKGGKNGAGIGGGYNKNREGGGGDITITGGTVFATGGYNGAGIGGGNNGDGGTIEITGGRVFATGGTNGAGIGTGNKGDDCEISLEWTNATDSIYASSFKGGIEFNSLFWNETADAEASMSNIKNGARLIPAAEVDIDEGEHGTVSMDGNVAALGSKVILTVIPDAHYFLEELSVTDDDDNDVDVSFSGTSAVFTMPASDAYVEAYFNSLKSRQTAVFTKKPGAVKGLSYNGMDKELIIKGEADGGTPYYAVTKDKNKKPDRKSYDTKIPSAKEPGIYYVWYMCIGDEDHGDTEESCLEVTIAEKEEEKEEEKKQEEQKEEDKKPEEQKEEKKEEDKKEEDKKEEEKKEEDKKEEDKKEEEKKAEDPFIPVSSPLSHIHRTDGSDVESLSSGNARYTFSVLDNPVVIANTKENISSAFSVLKSDPAFRNSAKHRYTCSNKKCLKINNKGEIKVKAAGEVDIYCEQKIKGGSWEKIGSPLHLYIQMPVMDKKAEMGLNDQNVSAFSFLHHTTYSPTEDFISTNEKVAVVDPDGTIRALKPGKTTIIAKYGEGKRGSKKKYKTRLKVKG